MAVLFFCQHSTQIELDSQSPAPSRQANQKLFRLNLQKIALQRFVKTKRQLTVRTTVLQLCCAVLCCAVGIEIFLESHFQWPKLYR